MKKFFQKLPLNRFKIITVFLLLTVDLMFISYFYQTISNRPFIERVLEQGLARQEMSLDDISPQDQEHAYQFMLNSLKITFVLFFAFHSLLALLFYFGKKSSWLYFKYYSLLAFLSLPFLLILKFHIILLVATPLSFSVTLGLFSRPWEDTKSMT